MANKITNRDEVILEAAIECALEDGYQWITRAVVARTAARMLGESTEGARTNLATGTINLAYGDMRGLKRAVLKAAVERGIIKLVAQGLADQHPIATDAPADVKAQAAALLMSA